MMKHESAGSCVVILYMQVQPLGNYNFFPLITRALSTQKRSVNEKNDDARYAMKIEKIPNHLHTYAHNNLKQHISRK
jgi:hypothetical protein